MRNIVSVCGLIVAGLAFESSRTINVIDTHCAGEPARIVVGGIMDVPGDTMADKKAYMRDRQDHMRKMLMLEPRGHDDMFGAYLVPPVEDNSDFGIIFMDSGGYLNMCGHDTIAAVMATITTGMVRVAQPETIVRLDTPAGLVEAHAAVSGEGNHVGEVGFRNVESFLYESHTVMTPDHLGLGEISFDIAFGGSFFMILKAAYVGLEIKPENAKKFADIGIRLKDWVNEAFPVQHPTLPYIHTIDLVEFYAADENEDEAPGDDDVVRATNVVVFGDGQVDRSPCGTGTSAKVATLHAKGQLKVGQKFLYKSILGTEFSAHIEESTTIANDTHIFPAVIPYVAGEAYITGFNTIVLDPRDPLDQGFRLG